MDNPPRYVIELVTDADVIHWRVRDLEQNSRIIAVAFTRADANDYADFRNQNARRPLPGPIVYLTVVRPTNDPRLS
jgi:hypothetical protein